jgi:hypothetical protein
MANANETGAKKPIYKKWWFWVLAVFILGALGSGASDTSTNTASNTGSQNQTAQDGNQPADTKQEAAPASYKVGDTVKLNNHEIVVKSVDKNHKSGNPYIKPQSSANTYVVIDVAVSNTGNQELPANQYGFKLEDETGTQRNVTYVDNIDGPMEWVTLSPGGKMSGKMVFEAKQNSSVYKLHYSPGSFGGKEVVIDL